MYKKVMVMLSLVLLVYTTALADTILTPTGTRIFDCSHSTYRMSIPRNDGSCFLMGTSTEELQDWISFVSSDSQIVWTVSCPASSYYSGAVQVDDFVYVFVNEYGKPVVDRKPYLLPLAIDGTQYAPIYLPAWTADAAIVKVDSEIFFYSNGTDPMKVAQFDTSLGILWEVESDEVSNTFNQIVDFCKLGEDYVLLASNSEGNGNGLVLIDRRDKHVEVRNLYQDGYATAIACSQDEIYVLLHKPQETLSSYCMVTTNREGGHETKQEIISKSEDITLTDMFIGNQSYLYTGSRYYGSKPPEVVVVRLNQEGRIQIQDIAEVKDTMSQTIVLPDNTIMVWGTNAGEDGQGDGRMICNTYSWAD